ncbi:hypothetical protein NE237_032053 [Protea cynaroides]|uniref:Uncharacterized protein n=1 Tax=Protea cynaroides TaxID=273540 RepID=A0A9Q0L3M4_9MAGN|nr:hypothetical protein NE237_032053 [Protea cynaroides]
MSITLQLLNLWIGIDPTMEMFKLIFLCSYEGEKLRNGWCTCVDQGTPKVYIISVEVLRPVKSNDSLNRYGYYTILLIKFEENIDLAEKKETCRKSMIQKVSYFSICETLYDSDLPSSGICESFHHQSVYGALSTSLQSREGFPAHNEAHGDVLLNIYQVLNKADEATVEPKWPKKFSYNSEILETYNLPF